MQITSAAKNYLYRRITTVGLYNEAAALPFARLKFRIFPGFTDKKKPLGKRLANKMERISCPVKEGANKQVISSQADSLIKISRIWADFFPANTS
ncbi:hypothetical protein, partial [Klebsiella pneumoniae]|uniref:hypothetical protein n=1 Tax=Klebsiella pneumoniae TaxID=573 RepID=UPI0015F2F221